MNTLVAHGIDYVFHVAPLHYVPFIARSRQLKSKATLRTDGFAETHFRSKSKRLDAQRGFGDYVHLTTVSRPPILEAKLAGGFPHVCISIPTISLNGANYDLCRYNVAMTRQLRRNGKSGFQEAPQNGRYYEDMQIPIARTELEQRQLIDACQGKMLEVLCKPPIPLPQGTSLTVFGNDDREATQRVLDELGLDWSTSISNEPSYEPSAKYFEACLSFIETSLGNLDWKGNGLEFDKV